MGNTFTRDQWILAAELSALTYLIPDPLPRKDEPGIYTGILAKEHFDSASLHKGEYLFLRCAPTRAIDVKKVLLRHEVDVKRAHDDPNAKNPQAYFAVSKSDLMNWIGDNSVSILLRQCKAMEEVGAESETIPLDTLQRDKIQSIRKLIDPRGFTEDSYPGHGKLEEPTFEFEPDPRSADGSDGQAHQRRVHMRRTLRKPSTIVPGT